MRDNCSEDQTGDPSDRDERDQANEPKSDSDAFLRRFHSAKSGSRQALGELFGQFRQYLLLIANQNVPSSISQKVGASDLVQETFFEACKIFERFEGDTPEQLQAWLVAILRFKVAQIRRYYEATDKRNVAWEVSLEDLPEENHCTDEQDLTCISQAATQLANLHLAIQRLPEDYRLAIELRGLQNLSFGELAKHLGRSVEAARKIWMRAVIRLQKELTHSPTEFSSSEDYGRQSSIT